MSNKLNVRVQNKRDTIANWESNNPILLKGEIAIVQALNGNVKVKVGDGITAFNDLVYISGDIDPSTILKEHNTSTSAHSNMGWLNTEEKEITQVESLGVNADTLGGIAASEYAKKTDLTNYVQSTELAEYATTESVAAVDQKIDTLTATVRQINTLLDDINGAVIN